MKNLSKISTCTKIPKLAPFARSFFFSGGPSDGVEEIVRNRASCSLLETLLGEQEQGPLGGERPPQQPEGMFGEFGGGGLGGLGGGGGGGGGFSLTGGQILSLIQSFQQTQRREGAAE